MANFRLVALGTVLTVWWLISVGNQFRAGAWTHRIRRYIPLGLIPLWTFFAPNPARADARLVWREDYGADWRGWQELHFGFAPLRRRWLFNPEIVLNKAINDLTGFLLRAHPGPEDRSALLSGAYITLLSIVLSQPRAAGCSSIQFAVVRTFTGSLARRLEAVFLSEIHEVTGPASHVSSHVF